MDFNNIFNRKPAENLGDINSLQDGFIYWSVYITTIAPYGRTGTAIELARPIYKTLERQLRDSPENLRLQTGIDLVAEKMLVHQLQEVFAELGGFIKSRDPAPPEISWDGSSELIRFLDNIRTTHDRAVFIFYDNIREMAVAYFHLTTIPVSKRDAVLEKTLDVVSTRIGELMSDMKKVLAENRSHFGNAKITLKRKLPKHLHRLVDKVVELVAYEPYELGIAYIRQNFPGPAGALYGLGE